MPTLRETDLRRFLLIANGDAKFLILHSGFGVRLFDISVSKRHVSRPASATADQKREGTGGRNTYGDNDVGAKRSDEQ